MPPILAIRKAEIEGSQFKASLGKKSLRLYLKKQGHVTPD
jgi:hypothetical protein